MAATTTLLGLVTPTQGTLSGTWGDTVNYGISDYVDISVAGTLTLTNDGAVTLANTTGSSSGNSITSSLTGAGTVTAQFAIVKVTGTLTVAKVVTGPSYSKTYTVVNSATGGIVTFKASGQTGVSIAVGESAFVYYNGTDYVKVSGTVAVASFQTSLGGLTPSTATTGVVTLAGTLNTTSGGTGLTSFTAGDVPYYTSGSVLSKLAIGTAGQFLTSTGTAPQWSTLSGVAVTTFSAGTTGFTPSSATSGAITLAGTLATTNGGTGLTSFTSGGVVYASSSSALATGSALTFDGTNLGVGIASATSLLDVRDGVGSIFTLGNTGNFAASEFSRIKWKEGSTQLADIGWEADTNELRINNRVASTTFYAANAEGMRLTSTGLGIGTSSPNFKLEVNSGATATTAQLKTTAATAYSGGSFFAGPNLTIRTGANATGNGSGIRFASDNNGLLEGMFGWVQNASAYGDFVWQGFNGSYVERMRLDSAGNLGLGVTPTVSSLASFQSTYGIFIGNNEAHTTKNAYYNAGWKYVAAASTTAARFSVGESTSAFTWNQAVAGTAGNAITFTQAMTLDASGNLGVGTTTPGVTGYGKAVRLQGSGNAAYEVTDGTVTTVLLATGGSSGIVRTDSNHPLVFGTNGTERARIDSSGYMFVGRTSDSDDGGLTLGNDGFIRSNRNGGVCILANRFTSDGQCVVFRRSGTTVGSIDVTTVLTTYNTTSDYRLKTVIGAVTGHGARIDALEPVEYTWNSNGSRTRGFLAHKFQEVYADSVSGTKDAVDKDGKPEYQSMQASSSEVIADLVAEIQSLRQRLSAANL